VSVVVIRACGSDYSLVTALCVAIVLIFILADITYIGSESSLAISL
jgi:hypothetical protein